MIYYLHVAAKFSARILLQILLQTEDFFTHMYMIFKYSKRFRFAPSFNYLILVLGHRKWKNYKSKLFSSSGY